MALLRALVISSEAETSLIIVRLGIIRESWVRAGQAHSLGMTKQMAESTI